MASGANAKCRWELRFSVLVGAVGVSSWLLINGVWGELAALVPALPEGWALPSHITAAVEASNVCPLVYVIVSALPAARRNAGRQRRADVIATGAAGALNTLMCAVAASCWCRHPLLAQHSGVLILCVFLSGLASTLSTIVMFSFASRLPDPRCTVAMQIGMVLSGAIPAAAALAQAPGQTYQRFSVEAYFWLLCGTGLACCACFAVLMIARRPQLFSEEASAAAEELGEVGSPLLAGPSPAFPAERHCPWADPAALFALNFVENGALPQLVSYAALPFGLLALELCSALSILLAPLACLAPLFLRRSPSGAVLCVCALLPFGYVLAAAAMSPKPFLCGTNDAAGAALVILSYVGDKALLAYAKTVTWVRVRERQAGGRGAKHLGLLAGSCQQGGSFTGALVFFLLVNFAGAFEAA